MMDTGKRAREKNKNYNIAAHRLNVKLVNISNGLDKYTYDLCVPHFS